MPRKNTYQTKAIELCLTWWITHPLEPWMNQFTSLTYLFYFTFLVILLFFSSSASHITHEGPDIWALTGSKLQFATLVKGLHGCNFTWKYLWSWKLFKELLYCCFPLKKNVSFLLPTFSVHPMRFRRSSRWSIFGVESLKPSENYFMYPKGFNWTEYKIKRWNLYSTLTCL